MGKTAIEWATHTANWLAGCTKVVLRDADGRPAATACQHCYAETMTARLATMPAAPARYRDAVTEGRRWTGRVSYDQDAIVALFTALHSPKTKPRRVFCNSMSDTFHADAPRAALAALADAIQILDEARPDHQHVIMLLTKRPENALAWQREFFPEGLPSWVWIGCTVEHQIAADTRIPLLLQIRVQDGGVRFLSCEPLLSAIDLPYRATLDGEATDYIPGIHWVIAGGESGHHARPSHPDWFRSLRDQCEAAGVAFFFKQHGAWAPSDDIDATGLAARGYHEEDPRDGGVPRHSWPDAPVRETARQLGKGELDHEVSGDTTVYRVGKHAAGRLLDGREHSAFPVRTTT